MTFALGSALPRAPFEGGEVEAGAEEIRRLLSGDDRPSFLQAKPWSRERLLDTLANNLRDDAATLFDPFASALGQAVSEVPAGDRSQAYLDWLKDLGQGDGPAALERLMVRAGMDAAARRVFLVALGARQRQLGRLMATSVAMARLGLAARPWLEGSSPEQAAWHALAEGLLEPTGSHVGREAEVDALAERWARVVDDLLAATRALNAAQSRASTMDDVDDAVMLVTEAERRRAVSLLAHASAVTDLAPLLALDAAAFMRSLEGRDPDFLVATWPLLEAGLACPLARIAPPGSLPRNREDEAARGMAGGRLARWWRHVAPLYRERPGPVGRLGAALTETRFASWLGDVLRGELGVSERPPHPRVGPLLARSWTATVLLGVVALLLLLLIVLPLGYRLGAAFHEGRGERWARLLDLGFVLPGFWVGSVAMLLLSGLWPTQGLHGPEIAEAIAEGRLSAHDPRALLDALQHLLLPAVVLVLPAIPVLVRYLATEVARILESDHVVLARSRGLRGGRLFRRHVLRASILPLVSQIPGILPGLFGGAVLVEVLFGLPGVGRIAWSAARAGDLAVVMGVTTLGTVLVLVAHLLSDLIAAWLDPRRALDSGERP